MIFAVCYKHSVQTDFVSTHSFSEDQAKVGARRLARCLQKLGFKVKVIAYETLMIYIVLVYVHERFSRSNTNVREQTPILHVEYN